MGKDDVPVRRTPLKRNPSNSKTTRKKKTPGRALSALLDRIAGQACRDRGYCEIASFTKRHAVEEDDGTFRQPRCGGPLSWCHIKSRFHQKVRWDPLNAVCGCHSCHMYMTTHPDEWVRFIDEKYPGRWEYLNERLLDKTKTNKEAWLEFYRS